MDWRLNSRKSKVFASTPRVRQALRDAQPDLRVASDFTDLGVVQAVGKSRRCPASAARTAKARLRFHRVGALPVPFEIRRLLGQAAGTAVGAYGSAVGPPPSAALRQLRSAAREAVLHGARRAAPEVLFSLLTAAWRLDPLARTVLEPLVALARALRGRFVDLESLGNVAAAWAAHHWRGRGPVAAAMASLARLGLGRQPLEWRVAGTRQLLDPRLAAHRDVVLFLLQRWREVQWQELARRRPRFLHLARGADVAVTRRGLSALPADQAGALRVIMAGFVVTPKWVSATLSGSPKAAFGGFSGFVKGPLRGLLRGL